MSWINSRMWYCSQQSGSIWDIISNVRGEKCLLWIRISNNTESTFHANAKTFTAVFFWGVFFCFFFNCSIIWNNAGILSIGCLGTNFDEILIEFLTLSFKKMRLKVSSTKWRPFCLGLNVLNYLIVALCGEWCQIMTLSGIVFQQNPIV